MPGSWLRAWGLGFEGCYGSIRGFPLRVLWFYNEVPFRGSFKGSVKASSEGSVKASFKGLLQGFRVGVLRAQGLGV